MSKNVGARLGCQISWARSDRLQVENVYSRATDVALLTHKPCDTSHFFLNDHFIIDSLNNHCDASTIGLGSILPNTLWCPEALPKVLAIISFMPLVCSMLTGIAFIDIRSEWPAQHRCRFYYVLMFVIMFPGVGRWAIMHVACRQHRSQCVF